LGFEAFEALRKSHTLAHIEKVAEEGELVVRGGVGGWGPLLHACGATSSMAGGESPNLRRGVETIGYAESHYRVPPEFCSVIKGQVGMYQLRRRNLEARGKKEMITKVLRFGGGCEQGVMTAELIRDEGYDVHIIQPLSAFKLAPERRQEYVDFYVSEAQRVAKWLTGKPIDEDKLAEDIHVRNIIIRKTVEILDLRLKNPLYFPMTKVTQMLRGASSFFATNVNYYERRAQFIDIQEQWIKELKEVANDPLPAYVPIVLAGNMFNIEMTRVIDESRGAIVGSIMAITTLYREDINPVRALGEYLLEMQIKGESSDQVGAVASARKYRIEEEINRTGAKGVIISGTTGCPYSSLTRQMEYDYFMKKQIPIIAVEGVSSLGIITEEVRMRLKAFIEMLI
jgi:benzoyl-CoA reductase/2-hydroxyglutaryl-CoA dehydratase subunit BcrC/BadD/HgdB